MLVLSGNEIDAQLSLPYDYSCNSPMKDLELGWIIKFIELNNDYIVVSNCPWNGYSIGAAEFNKHYIIL